MMIEYDDTAATFVCCKAEQKAIITKAKIIMIPARGPQTMFL